MTLLGFPTEEREKDDFYPTPAWATQALIDNYGTRIRELIGTDFYVWEPACGDGAMSDVLIENGIPVFSSDLIDRDYGHVINFLSNNDNPYGSRGIITNPPFKLAEEFIRKAHSLDNNKFTCMFLRLSFLEGQKRKKLFEEFPPKYVYVFSKRVSLGRADSAEKNMNAVAYAWFVWEKGFNGEPTIRWI